MTSIKDINSAIMFGNFTNTELSSIIDARAELFLGLKVFYNSSW